MLPITADNGARLAGILPSGIAAVALHRTIDPEELRSTLAPHRSPELAQAWEEHLPRLRACVLIVVDGLGAANFKARRAHAPHLAALSSRRIETVAPSTTAAALTTLTTGAMPGEHGLIGYRIRHPELGLISALKDWDEITEPRQWQRATPLLSHASRWGIEAFALGRPAFAQSGLTTAILNGATYLPGQRIADRFRSLAQKISAPQESIAYLYVDELDKAAHEFGWQSAEWVRRLEQLDEAFGDFMTTLPKDVGVVVTADHGIVDVTAQQQITLEELPGLAQQLAHIGGEPRFRSLYLRDGVDAAAVTQQLRKTEAKRAWVMTRDEAVAHGLFGAVSSEVLPRLGDVILAARKSIAYYSEQDEVRAREMVGQHGSLTEEERGVPVMLAGALAGTGYFSTLSR